MRLRAGPALLLALAAAGCAAPHPRRVVARAAPSSVPPFARVPYEPFSRTDTIAIALREWRLFGSPVDDEPPGTRPRPLPEEKPERQPGLWQRVGEYWWISQDSSRLEAAWTGMHDENGLVFPADRDFDYAWSAAFISYVMRIAGAGPRFPYSPAHHTYIDIGRLVSLGSTTGWVVSAEPPDTYAPQLGDLICESRTPRPLRFEDLPAGPFAAHCDIVVQQTPGELSVIGGNVDDAVTLKHVPVTAEGCLAFPGGHVLDDRYAWFVVLRVLYDR